MDDEAARLGALLRSGAAWKAIALQQSMSIATSVLSAAMASFEEEEQTSRGEVCWRNAANQE